MDVLEQARELQAWSSKHRRHLHQYPELSLQEEKTAAYCQVVLEELGYQVHSSWGYGFIADLKVDKAIKTIALRADMDALPIQEKNQHDFVSKHQGAAHMCGHDAHMAIALTTARILKENQQQLNCNVRFLFQPSEEQPPGGAPGMIENGCLEGVDEVYGLHNDSGTPVGKIRTKVGPLMAAGDRFDLQINGRGCHAARPQDGLDPIYAAVNLINNWQGLLTRFINPAHPAVLSVTKFQAGDTFNVIPDSAVLSGTVRTFVVQDRKLLQKAMTASVNALEALGYSSEFNYQCGYDAVINHKDGVAQVVRAAQKIVGDKNIDAETEPAGWAEDFGYYLQQRPGAFYFLGSGNSELEITAPLHSPHFDIDEAALPIGAAVMAQIVLQQK